MGDNREDQEHAEMSFLALWRFHSLSSCVLGRGFVRGFFPFTEGTGCQEEVAKSRRQHHDITSLLSTSHNLVWTCSDELFSTYRSLEVLY